MYNSYKRYWQPNYLQMLSISVLASAVATTLTYPFDFIKTIIHFRNEGVGIRHKRSHLWGYNPHRILQQMHELGGTSIIYRGFEMHLAARLSYLTLRNTLYFIGYQATKPAKATNDLTVYEKAGLASVAGGVAAFVTAPLDLINIRQILDTQIKPEWRRNYKGFESVNRLSASGELWHGAKVNVLRSVAINTTLTIPYDYFQEHLYFQFGTFQFVQHTSLFLAALTSTFITCPLDHLRTRWMMQFKEYDRNRLNYRTIGDFFALSSRVEGFKSLWAGATTYFGKVFIYAFLTVGITNSITDALKQRAGLEDWQL